MQLNEYQLWTRTTAIYPKYKAIDYLIMGLVSEAGEVAGKRKKEIRDAVVNKQQIIDELGDVFWYLARLCDHYNIEAEMVLDLNKNKLEDRKARDVIKGNGDNR